MVNSHDPHRPFHNPADARSGWGTPTRLFTPDEVEVPSYLADLPGVRVELSHYHTSVRCLDDTFSRVVGEFYDLENDPGCVKNLIDHPAYQSTIVSFQQRLASWMKETGDPALSAFRKHDSLAAIRQALDENYPKKEDLLSGTQREKQAKKRSAGENKRQNRRREEK